MGEIFELVQPETPLTWTGERFTTGSIHGQIEVEHLHRYFIARTLCRGQDVLDVASGEGYGSALLAQTARSVVGVEVSEQAVTHAARVYRRDNLRYEHGDARKLPLGNASVDAVVSFETLEHFLEHDRFIEEVKRVLRPSGRLILSSPDRDVYSPPGGSANPYHANELTRAEFEALLRRSFAHVTIFSQRPLLGSALIGDDGDGPMRTLTFEKRGPAHYETNGGLSRAPYLVAFASDVPFEAVPNSVLVETSDIQGLFAGLSRRAESPPEGKESAEALKTELSAVRHQRDMIRNAFQMRSINVSRVAMLEAELAEAQRRADRLEGELVGAKDRANRLDTELIGSQRSAEQLSSDLRTEQEHSRALDERSRILQGQIDRIASLTGYKRVKGLLPASLKQAMHGRRSGGDE